MMMQSLLSGTMNLISKFCLTISGVIIQIYSLAFSGMILIMILVLVYVGVYRRNPNKCGLKPPFGPVCRGNFFDTFQMFWEDSEVKICQTARPLKCLSACYRQDATLLSVDIFAIFSELQAIFLTKNHI